MQISITINESFNDADALIEFAAKVRALFSSFSPKVVADVAPTPRAPVARRAVPDAAVQVVEPDSPAAAELEPVAVEPDVVAEQPAVSVPSVGAQPRRGRGRPKRQPERVFVQPLIEPQASAGVPQASAGVPQASAGVPQSIGETKPSAQVDAFELFDTKPVVQPASFTQPAIKVEPAPVAPKPAAPSSPTDEHAVHRLKIFERFTALVGKPNGQNDAMALLTKLGTTKISQISPDKLIEAEQLLSAAGV